MHTHIKRRDGMRPTTTVRSEPGRVYATHHTAETPRLEQGAAAYRSAYLIIQGFGRLQGRSLSFSPLSLHYAQRIVGLICPRTITLRVVVLPPCVVRRHPAHQGATHKGIYPGQLGRQTTCPTTDKAAPHLSRPDAVARHSQRLYLHSRDTTP